MLTNEEFLIRLKKISPKIYPLEKYSKSHDNIFVKCLDCGGKWKPKAYALLQGKGCPHCSAVKGSKKNSGKTGIKLEKTFLKEMQSIHPNIKIVGCYINTHTDIDCLCKICDNKWKAKPYSLLQGHGCPRCAKSGTSFMEQFIRLCFERKLGKQNVLSRDKSLVGKELDIVIPEYKIAIEPGNWWLHKNRLEKDREKRELCKNKGIRLITIYDKFPENAIPPFEKDCLTYCYDLNKEAHKHLRQLVKGLFSFTKLKAEFTEKEWEQIEKEAYNNSLAKTHKDFVAEMHNINPTIEILGKYTNASRKIIVKCKNCGFTWEGVPANLKRGDGCRKCGTKQAHKKFIKDQKYFEEQLGEKTLM